MLVVAAQPSGAHAELEATVAQHVERRRLLGQHHRVLVVVVEHQARHPELRGGGGGDGHGRHRRQLVVEVVGHEQAGEALVLETAGQVPPLGAGTGAGHLGTEAEGANGHERAA